MRLFVFVIFNIFNLLIRENTGSVVNDDGISSNSEHLVIRLPELGQLKGSTIQTARTNETIFQFLDVKYGESPSGERRFKVSFFEMFVFMNFVNCERCENIFC